MRGKYIKLNHLILHIIIMIYYTLIIWNITYFIECQNHVYNEYNVLHGFKITERERHDIIFDRNAIFIILSIENFVSVQSARGRRHQWHCYALPIQIQHDDNYRISSSNRYTDNDDVYNNNIFTVIHEG